MVELWSRKNRLKYYQNVTSRNCKTTNLVVAGSTPADRTILKALQTKGFKVFAVDENHPRKHSLYSNLTVFDRRLVVEKMVECPVEFCSIGKWCSAESSVNFSQESHTSLRPVSPNLECFGVSRG